MNAFKDWKYWAMVIPIFLFLFFLTEIIFNYVLRPLGCN
jgi:hypothetical protein